MFGPIFDAHVGNTHKKIILETGRLSGWQVLLLAVRTLYSSMFRHIGPCLVIAVYDCVTGKANRLTVCNQEKRGILAAIADMFLIPNNKCALPVGL